MNKKVIIAIAAVVAAAALFAGGAYVGPRLLGVPVVGAPGDTRGPMGQLTEEERAQVSNMSESERQAFFQEKMGAGAPTGAAGRMGGPGGQRVIEGEIASVSSDQITIKTTSGGSQAVYFDDKTVVAIAEGSAATEPTTGGKVSAVVTPETDNVLAASIIVLR